jgi:hypothetical protein
MMPTVAPAPLSSGFPVLDYWLGGGYPCAALTTLSGGSHAAKRLLAQVHAHAIAEGMRVGMLAAATYGNSPRRLVELWSDVAAQLFEEVEVLLLEGLTPPQCAALPATLPASLARHHRTLLVTLTAATPLPAALQLHLLPSGWLYRHRTVTAYRLYITATAPRRKARQPGITVEMMVSR